VSTQEWSELLEHGDADIRNMRPAPVPELELPDDERDEAPAERCHFRGCEAEARLVAAIRSRLRSPRWTPYCFRHAELVDRLLPGSRRFRSVNELDWRQEAPEP
jgi:hypothetical protein